MQPAAVRQHRVDERGAQIHPSAGRLEHLLHQVAYLRLTQDRRGQLRTPPPGHEDPARLVDPVQRAADLYLCQMRSAVYTRISRDEAGEGLGVARQRSDCEALLARKGWVLAGEYCDNYLSAFTGRPRPAYQRLLLDLAAGRVDAVVAWAPERLHRSPRELEDFIQLLDETGAHVETVKAGAWDVSTSHGRLVARMLGAVSRAESERTGERVARAHAQAKQAGLWRGPIPFGMQTSDEPGKPEPDVAQAPIVEEAFLRVLRGDALTAIARDFNARGLLPRRGQRWSHTGISRLIGSPALGGMVNIGGEFVPAAFDGVVSEQRWRSAQAALVRRPRGEARRPREKLTLLGGILTCAEHGDLLWGGGKIHAAIYVPGAPVVAATSASLALRPTSSSRSS